MRENAGTTPWPRWRNTATTLPLHPSDETPALSVNLLRQVSQMSADVERSIMEMCAQNNKFMSASKPAMVGSWGGRPAILSRSTFWSAQLATFAPSCFPFALGSPRRAYE